MADEARLSGINWREAFPFTHLFRSFRIAVHPSKLGLGLIALICLYAGGRFFDWAWPARHMAVPGEPALYAEHGTVGGSPNAFREERARIRRQIEQNYADELQRRGIVKDRVPAEEAARTADELDKVKDSILKERTEAVSRADQALRDELAAAEKVTDKAQRRQMELDAHVRRDEAVRAAYRRANDQWQQARAVKGSGIFEELFEYQTHQVVGVVNGVARWNWLGGIHNDASPGVIRSVFNFFGVGPMWLFWNHPFYFVLFSLLFLTVWAIFGGAIARIAAVHVARDEKLSVRAALSFSASKFLSFVSAPLIPVIIIGLVGLVPFVAGLLSSIPYIGPVFYIIMAVLFFVLLAAGFIMTLVLIGLVAGLNLMYPTIAVEGSDSFDAISRSFSYVYARPWRMIWHTVVAIVYGALCYIFVRFFIYLMLALTHRFVGAGMFALAPSTEPLWPVMWRGPSSTGTLSYEPGFLTLRWDQDLAAGLIAFWVYLLISVLGAFAISFYFTANTIIYYLMRREVDATEMDDVYLEQSDEDFADSGPVSATTASAERTGGTPADVPPGAKVEREEEDETET